MHCCINCFDCFICGWLKWLLWTLDNPHQFQTLQMSRTLKTYRYIKNSLEKETLFVVEQAAINGQHIRNIKKVVIYIFFRNALPEYCEQFSFGEAYRKFIMTPIEWIKWIFEWATSIKHCCKRCNFCVTQMAFSENIRFIDKFNLPWRFFAVPFYSPIWNYTAQRLPFKLQIQSI